MVRAVRMRLSLGGCCALSLHTIIWKAPPGHLVDEGSTDATVLHQKATWLF